MLTPRAPESDGSVLNRAETQADPRDPSEPTNTESIDVAAAWAGLIGVGLFLVSSLLAGSVPKPDASTAAVTTFLVQQRSSLLIGTVLLMLAIPFLGCFVGVFTGVLRQAEGGRGTLTGAATLGWTLMLAVVSVGVLSQAALVWRGADALDPHLVRFGYDVSTLSLYAISAMAVALTVGATSVVILRTRVLPRWLAVLGLVEVAVNLIELAGLGSRGGPNAAGYASGIGPLIWSVWVVTAAILVVRYLRHSMSDGRSPAADGL